MEHTRSMMLSASPSTVGEPSRTPSVARSPENPSAVINSAPAKRSHNMLTPPVRQEHAPPLPSASRSSKLAVVLTSPPKRPTSQMSQMPHTQPRQAIQRTLHHMWELSRRAKKTLDTASEPPQSTTPQAQSLSKPIPSTTSSTPAYSGRGRPKGWKPGMSYATMRGRSPAPQKSPRQPRQARVNAPPLVWGRRPGRPPRPRSPTPKELYHKVTSHFLAFLCEWSGCKAELHNLDTLRKHVHAVHGQKLAPTTCQWARCKDQVFTNQSDWHAHLEEAHFTPFTWHMGEGPRNTSDVLTNGTQELPDYLTGADGTQVTPSIRDQELEDFVTWRENRRRLKELLILRDKNLPDLSSESSDEMD